MKILTSEIQELCQTAAWVEEAQRGNRQAFGRLYERFEGMVCRVALQYLRNLQDAQELTQDVFVQALEKIDQLRAAEAFGSWLKSIAIRMAINRLERRGRRLTSALDPAGQTDKRQDSPLESALRVETSAQLRAGLQRLRPLDRRTLVAFYVRGESLAEMAQSCRAPVGTIKRRLHVARKRLAHEVAALAQP